MKWASILSVSSLGVAVMASPAIKRASQAYRLRVDGGFDDIHGQYLSLYGSNLAAPGEGRTNTPLQVYVQDAGNGAVSVHPSDNGGNVLALVENNGILEFQSIAQPSGDASSNVRWDEFTLGNPLADNSQDLLFGDASADPGWLATAASSGEMDVMWSDGSSSITGNIEKIQIALEPIS